MRTGRVTTFDAHRGIGVISPDHTVDDGSPGENLSGDPIMFHCIEIADGTRMIEVGTVVRYRVGLKLGRPEAFGVTPTVGDPTR
jgi:cold shock CspA family protein